MNPDNQIIPIVEDDQGEGWKDPYEEQDKFHKKLLKEQFKKAQRKMAVKK